MNCKEIKYFLLGCENPDQPPAEVKAHLAVCKGCQDWENRLAVIELNIPFLPVPASAARAQLLRKVLSFPVLVRGEERVPIAAQETATQATRKESSPVDLKQLDSPVKSSAANLSPRTGTDILRFFRTLEPSARRFAAGGIAAAVLLIVFGWLVMRTPNRTRNSDLQMARASTDPLLANIIQRDLRLADANKPADRFLALADLAEDLSGEVKNLAPLPEAKGVLDDLVRRYQKVVRDGLLPVAKKLSEQKLSAKDRDDLLNTVGERLHVAGRKTEELGDQLASKIPNSSREALRRLSKAAYEGDQRLRDLRVQNLRNEPRDVRAPDSAVLVRRGNP
jgi:hypothetical protein